MLLTSQQKYKEATLTHVNKHADKLGPMANPAGMDQWEASMGCQTFSISAMIYEQIAE